MTGRRKQGRAFTLIEMLVVVGIISILMIIGVPNYRTAQTRARVGRVKAELATLAIAFESYAVDYNRYPNSCVLRSACSGGWGSISGCKGLTTPVAYLTNLDMPDPFMIRGMREGADNLVHGMGGKGGYAYANSHGPNSIGPAYMLFSPGPFQKHIRAGANVLDSFTLHVLLGKKPRPYFDRFQYDPSNGVMSRGYVQRYQQ